MALLLGGMLFLALWRPLRQWLPRLVLCLAGLLFARASVQTQQVCLDRMLVLEEWEAVLDEPASPSAFVRAQLEFGGCSVRADLAIVAGSASAGERVRVSGIARGSTTHILVQGARISPLRGGSALVSVRGWARATIDDMFGTRAPIVRALLTADGRQIPRDIRDNFADAGMVHMLSISGLHVGIIAGSALLLIRAAGAGVATATAISAALTALYVLLIGAPPAAMRAGAMLFVLAASRLLQRPTSPWAALAVGALVPLVNPATVTSIGYQLSIAGMAGLICAGQAMRALASRGLSGWRANLAGALIATVFASLITAPIVGWHFGRLSLIAPVTNLAGGPVIAMLQPLLFAAMLTSPIPPLSGLLVDAATPLIDLLQGIARFGAAVPGAATDVAPSLFAAALAGVAATATIFALVEARYRHRLIVLTMGSCVLLVWQPLLPSVATAGTLELHMIDVGQGDALALRLPGGDWILFDAGRSWRGGDAGRRSIVPYLRRRGGELEAFVLSHPHSDHVGGAASVLRWLSPAFFWDAGYVAGNSDYAAALAEAQRRRINWKRVRPGASLPADKVVIEFLAPDSAWAAHLDDPNDASTVVLVTYGAVRFLLTGDAENEEEEWLLARYGARLRADVLKVAHHGSRSSSSEKFLDAVRPSIALISVGEGNSYGHPSEIVLGRLRERGAIVARSDRHGSVAVATDGKSIWLDVQGGRVRVK